MRYLKIVLVISITSILSAGILSFANILLQKKIEENEKRAINEAIYKIEPKTKSIKILSIKDELIYKIFDSNKKLLGYAFLAEGQGYQGKIKIMCGVDKDFEKILGIEIIESVETPGLGGRINEAWFKDQFKNLIFSPCITYTKTKPEKKNEIQAITGATISSRAVVNILNKKIKKIKKILKK